MYIWGLKKLSMEDKTLLKFYVHHNMYDKQDDYIKRKNMKLESFYALTFHWE